MTTERDSNIGRLHSSGRGRKARSEAVGHDKVILSLSASKQCPREGGRVCLAFDADDTAEKAAAAISRKRFPFERLSVAYEGFSRGKIMYERAKMHKRCIVLSREAHDPLHHALAYEFEYVQRMKDNLLFQRKH